MGMHRLARLLRQQRPGLETTHHGIVGKMEEQGFGSERVWAV